VPFLTSRFSLVIKRLIVQIAELQPDCGQHRTSVAPAEAVDQ
jgi:hypothetical protein